MKPADITYGLGDKPGFAMSCLLAFQHVCIFGIGLVMPVLLVRLLGGSTQQAMFLVSMSMLAGGIGAVVQAMGKGPLGSGYLCPQINSSLYMPASLLAGKTGGLSLVMGMTMMSGAMEGIFSRIVSKLRFMFPTEVSGLIVAMVGLAVIRLACVSMLGMEKLTDPPNLDSVVVGCGTLLTIVVLNVWSRGQLKLFCITIGMLTGYVLSFSMGLLDDNHLSQIAAQPLIWMPLAHHPGWSFDWNLVLPFAVVMLCSSLKCMGDITTCQKINDADWKRPNMRNIGNGVMANGAGSFGSGLLGGFGLTTSSANVGLTIATGATSRYLAIYIGAFLALMAFFPKFAASFAIMPKPVIGATLLFILSFTVVAGFQIIMSRMLDNRKTFLVGFSLILGLMVDIVPEAFKTLPHALHTIFYSSLSTAAISAVILNLIFRLGIASKARLELVGDQRTAQNVFEFMGKHGAAWGARKDVIHTAITVISEFVECILPAVMDDDKIILRICFDEYSLKANLLYKGRPFEVPRESPGLQDLPDDSCIQTHLSWRIIQHYVQNMKVTEQDGMQKIQLSFEH